MKRNRCIHAGYGEMIQCILHFFYGIKTIGSPCNKLRQKRIIVGRNDTAGVTVTVDPDSLALRWVPCVDMSRRGVKIPVRRLCIDTALDGMTRHLYVVLRDAERIPGGNIDLFLDEIHTRDHFRYGMLHLNARIHLEKVKGFLILIEYEFYGSRILITDMGGNPHRRIADPFPQFGRHHRRRSLLEYLLIPALEGTVALEEMYYITLPVSYNLNLYMAGIGYVTFDI